MKYLQNFLKFEAVIMPALPTDTQTKYFDTISELREYGEKNNFDVVTYDEFYESLGEDDKKTAPKNNGTCPFFALFHPIRKKPMFVLCTHGIPPIPNFKGIVDDYISHENVHGEQNLRRKGLTFKLPNPGIQKEYFSHSDEIMAFSWTIASDLSKSYKSLEEALEKLERPGYTMSQRLFDDIKKVCDEKVVNKYRKNIYNYLKKIYEKN